MHAQPLSHVQLFATPWTVARQAPLSMEFFRQEYWSGLACPPPDPRIEPTSPALQADSLLLSRRGSPKESLKTGKVDSQVSIHLVSRVCLSCARLCARSWGCSRAQGQRGPCPCGGHSLVIVTRGVLGVVFSSPGALKPVWCASSPGLTETRARRKLESQWYSEWVLGGMLMQRWWLW